MEEKNVPANPIAAKIDHGMNWGTRWFSYLGGIALLLMAIMLFVNIVSSKVFHKSFSNVNDLVDYLLIACVYCCAADCQLNGGGLVQVDIFFRMFPYGMKKVVKGVGYLLGFAMYSFTGYEAFSLLSKYFQYKETASASSSSFVIWPFCLLFIIGSFVLALALLWSVVRMFFLPRPETELGPGDYDLDELNVKGKLFTDPPGKKEEKK